MENKKIKIAIQKSGRLHDGSISLLQECGIKVNSYSSKLKSEAANFPLEILFLRDDDIPSYVAGGIADLGIVGENGLAESGSDVEIASKLGFGHCRLSIAMPRDREYTGVGDLDGIRIATTYPGILRDYLSRNQVNAEIHSISGSVEIAPSIGLAEGIFDIVSTGSTLAMNGLKEVEVVMRSEAVLIAGKNLSPDKSLLLSQILFRLGAVREAKNHRYVLLNVPNEKIDIISRILPGMNSPTIMPLAREGWSSLHSVLKEEEFWQVIESLKANGAEGILVVPVEKMFV
jgi:ATP phosphoribosyltransferase